LELSVQNILKLKRDIEHLSSEAFTRENDLQKIKISVDDLIISSQNFTNILQTGLGQEKISLSNRIQPIFTAFQNITFELSEFEYADNEINDPYSRKFIITMEPLLKSYQAAFTPENFNMFVQIVIQYIVQRLEEEIMKKRFNQLGALQLDRDMRAIITFFTTLISRSARDSFIRLQEVVSLLIIEKLAEVTDLWGSNGAITWRLRPSEIRNVLCLRVDFKQDAVTQIKI